MLPLLMLAALSTINLTAALLTYAQPFFLLGMRMTIAGGILLLYHHVRRHSLNLQKNHLLLYLHGILFAAFIPYALRHYGLLQVPFERATLIHYASPLITYALSCWWLVEKVTMRGITPLALGFAGIIMLVNPSSLSVFASCGWGDLALMGALISFSYGWLVLRNLIVNQNQSPLVVNGMVMTGGGLLGLTSSYWYESAPYVTQLPSFLVLLTALIIISNLIAHNLYATLLKTYSLTLLQASYWLTPVMTGLYKTVWLQEPITIPWIGAALLISASFALLYKQEVRSQQPVTQAV